VVGADHRQALIRFAAAFMRPPRASHKTVASPAASTATCGESAASATIGAALVQLRLVASHIEE